MNKSSEVWHKKTGFNRKQLLVTMSFVAVFGAVMSLCVAIYSVTRSVNLADAAFKDVAINSLEESDAVARQAAENFFACRQKIPSNTTAGCLLEAADLAAIRGADRYQVMVQIEAAVSEGLATPLAASKDGRAALMESERGEVFLKAALSLMLLAVILLVLRWPIGGRQPKSLA